MSTIPRLSSRSFAVAEHIRDRKGFNTHGALRATAVTPTSVGVYDSGQLSGDDLDAFRDQCREIEYVVYSYSTPIAWWTPTNGWHRVSQRFSRTTSAHQGKLYLIG